jgi:hypothetical protein
MRRASTSTMLLRRGLPPWASYGRNYPSSKPDKGNNLWQRIIEGIMKENSAANGINWASTFVI